VLIGRGAVHDLLVPLKKHGVHGRVSVAPRAPPDNGTTISISTSKAIHPSPMSPPPCRNCKAWCAFYKVLGTYL